MPRTREVLAAAAEAAEQNYHDVPGLHDMAVAMLKIADAEAELEQAVRKARVSGYSWIVIGKVLGVSRQAAQERYGPRA